MKKTAVSMLRRGVSKIVSSKSRYLSVFRIIALCACALLTAVQPLTANAYDSAAVRSAIRNGAVSSDGVVYTARPFFCLKSGEPVDDKAANIGGCSGGEELVHANIVVDPITREATNCSDYVGVHYGYLSANGRVTKDSRFYRIDSSKLNCQCGRKHCHSGKNWNNKTATDGTDYHDPNF